MIDRTHRDACPSLTDISLASKAEAVKTSKLLQDLQTTRAAIAAEIEQFQETRATHQGELNTIAAELKTLMEQHVGVIYICSFANITFARS